MEYIDKIFYINLDKRLDRKEQFLEECRKMEINQEKVERFSAISIPDTPALGCTYSHLDVVKIARDRHYKNVLIFEDDFEFVVEKEKLYSSLEYFFNKNLDYRVLMLSYNIENPENITKIDEILSTTTNAHAASGYIVNCVYFDELIACLSYGAEMLYQTGQHWNYTNDQIWKKLQGDKWFIFNDRIGKQRESYSDLAKAVVNYGI